MLEAILDTVLQHWMTLLPVVFVLYLLRNRYQKSLTKFPGPFLASLTNWWRLIDVLNRRPEVTQRKLHDQYGDFVRIGPNCISIADPKALKTVYGLNKGFTKSGFYPVQQALSGGQRLQSLFSTQDEQYHAQLRRCVNSAFSMSALVQYEPSVDIITEQFLAQTSKLYAQTGEVCDFGTWLQYYAFDVIGHITYSKSHGFIERNEDVEGMVGKLGGIFNYVAPIGQLPALDLLMSKNPIVRLLDYFNVKAFQFPVSTFAKARMAERLGSEAANGSASSVKRADLLSQFLKAKADHPDFFHDGRVLTMAVSMAFAGSETTGISLAAVFYYLLRNPKCLAKLRTELDTASSEVRRGSNDVAGWSESQSLPYLDTVIKETFRLHPAAGLPLERVVPPGGTEICGRFVPAGTIVGCSAWIIHKRPEIWGDDVDAFRPERWSEATPEKRKSMEGHLFQFGMGSRTCIGKNISLLEMYKLVPSFLRRFEIDFDDPEDDWVLHNAWFVKQHNFRCRFRERGIAEK